MARPLRIELAGGIYHVTSRGDRREDIYVDEADRQAWLGELAQGMRQLNGVYTQHVNRRHRRVGHVFQGRYKAILVEKESYLLELARYVVLNPVRAGMVADAAQWRWSSYGAMLGTEPAPPWLRTDWLLGQFGRQRAQAQARYRDFVRAGVGLPSL
jgi:REP element-mobilizing transposase RayT